MSNALTDLTEVAGLDTALSTLWQRHRQTNLDRISLLEVTAANVLRLTIDEGGIEEGSRAAHMLAGSLGTFGFDSGSRAALDAEYLLREEVIDGLRLAEAVTAVRASVQVDRGVSASITALGGTPPAVVNSDGATSVRVVSRDADLVSRFSVEATAVGLSVTGAQELSSVDTRGTFPPSVIVDDDANRTWTDAELLHSIRELSQRTTVFVLSDHDGFEDRMALARAGASGVAHRSQSPRQVISLLSEALARQHHAQSTVRACNTNAAIAELLKGALHGPDEHLELHASAEGLWDELDEYGGDLLVVGFDGPVLSGPELCRMVRAHTRWHRLPIVIVGDDHPSHLAEAMASGADDYVSADISSLELEIWLHTALRDRRIADTRSDVDPVTGTENRVALDRSLDRVFRRSMQDGEPFSLALVGIDQFEQMRSTEGSAVGDGALRRLGTRLTSSVPDGSAVGRWSDSTFAVGIYGALSQDAAGWIDGAIRALSAEGIPTTSGTLSHCTYSAGITSAPIDGSSFPSLERMCETALLRATAGEDSVVISGNRPGEGSEHVVDVVLVEDDDSVADVIEHALGLHQYGFLRFSDGAEAASALGDGRVKARVVLLDVGLPSLDGFGVLNVLRSKGLLGATRVIMLTARSSEAEMLRALGLGAMEHITKPFSIPVLLGRLDQTRASAML